MRAASRLFSAALLVALVASPAWARSIIDATKTRVELVEKPARIVTLAPSLAELAADALGEKGLARIVGVTEFTDYPAVLSSRQSVGPYFRFNIERVLGLKPDLVLATFDGNLEDQVRRLRELKLPVVVVETGTLAQVEASMKLVGEAVGESARGREMSDRFSRGVKQFRALAERSKARPRILLQVGDRPLVVAGARSILTEALALVGAVNVYRDADSRYPRPSLEDARARKPDAVLVLMLGKDRKPFDEMAASWKKIGITSRVLPGDTIVRPTLRMLDGLRLLYEACHAG